MKRKGHRVQSQDLVPETGAGVTDLAPETEAGVAGIGTGAGDPGREIGTETVDQGGTAEADGGTETGTETVTGVPAADGGTAMMTDTGGGHVRGPLWRARRRRRSGRRWTATTAR